jgi:hypothetical protein
MLLWIQPRIESELEKNLSFLKVYGMPVIQLSVPAYISQKILVHPSASLLCYNKGNPRTQDCQCLL